MREQLDTAHAGHVNVKHEAGRGQGSRIRKEFRSGRKGARGDLLGLKQHADGIPYRFVIVYDTDDAIIFHAQRYSVPS